MTRRAIAIAMLLLASEASAADPTPPAIAGDEHWKVPAADLIDQPPPIGRVIARIEVPTTPVTVSDDTYISYRFRLRTLGGEVTNSTSPSTASRLFAAFLDSNKELFVGIRMNSAFDKVLYNAVTPDSPPAAIPFTTLLTAKRTSRTAYQPLPAAPNSVLLGPRPLGPQGDVNVDVGFRYGENVTTTIPSLAIKAGQHILAGVGIAGGGLPILLANSFLSITSEQRQAADQYFGTALSTAIGSVDSNSPPRYPAVLKYEFFRQRGRLLIEIFDKNYDDAGRTTLVGFALEPDKPRPSLLPGVYIESNDKPLLASRWPAQLERPLVANEKRSSPVNILRGLPADSNRPSGDLLRYQINGLDSNALPNAANFNTACSQIQVVFSDLGFNQLDSDLLAYHFLKSSPLISNLAAVGDPATLKAQLSAGLPCPTQAMNTRFADLGLAALPAPKTAIEELISRRAQTSAADAEKSRKAALASQRNIITNSLPNVWGLTTMNPAHFVAGEFWLLNSGTDYFPIPAGRYTAASLEKEIAKIPNAANQRMAYSALSTDNWYVCAYVRGTPPAGGGVPNLIPIAFKFELDPQELDKPEPGPGARIASVEVDPKPASCSSTSRWTTEAEGLAKALARVASAKVQ